MDQRIIAALNHLGACVTPTPTECVAHDWVDETEPCPVGEARALALCPPEDPSATLSPEEFIEAGYLQEVNRRVLHPVGLALAVHSEESRDAGGYFSAMIYDARQDREGFLFVDLSSEKSEAKRDRVATAAASRIAAREEVLGPDCDREGLFVVQRIGSVLGPGGESD